MMFYLPVMNRLLFLLKVHIYAELRALTSALRKRSNKRND